MTRGLAVAKSLLTLHPWVLTVLLLGFNLAAGPVSWIAPPLAQTLNWLTVAVDMSWIWSIYTVSTAVVPERSRPAWEPWIFVVPSLVEMIAMIGKLSMNNSPAAFLFFAAFLFCIGRTAIALETADPSAAPTSMGKTLGTAALLFFSVVGVWWLRQRLLRVAARTPSV